MFINFLIYFLNLNADEVASAYVAWYGGFGAIIGSVVPAVCSLLCVILFYYVWSKFSATTSLHWLVMSLVNMILTYFVTVFVGKSSLSNYIAVELQDSDLSDTVAQWPFTADLWIFGLNAVVWAIVFYFVFSVILKNWSSSYNIPFGGKAKKITSKK